MLWVRSVKIYVIIIMDITDNDYYSDKGMEIEITNMWCMKTEAIPVLNGELGSEERTQQVFHQYSKEN